VPAVVPVRNSGECGQILPQVLIDVPVTHDTVAEDCDGSSRSFSAPHVEACAVRPVGERLDAPGD
jgi:hypothetical protein